MEKNLFISKLKGAVEELAEAEIEGVLYELSLSAKISSSELVQRTGLPKESLTKLKRQLSSYLVIDKGGLISLNEKGRELVKQLSPNLHLWSIGDVVAPDSDKVAKFYAIRKEYGKSASRELDQFYATPETSIKKAWVAMTKGEVEKKDVALLGDDDLVSVALVLLGAEFKSLTILDVDRELLAFIKRKTEQMGKNNVRTVFYDCREELNPVYKNVFDTVVTDCPYTRSGAELFLVRALELVKDGAERRIFFYYGASPRTPEKFFKIQELFQRRGVLIEDKIDKFARYDGAESMGSASSLYVLKTLPSTLRVPLTTNRRIYTHELEKEERFPFVDHVVIKAFRVSEALLRSKKRMLGVLNDFCKKHRLKVVDTKVTEFRGSGYTFVYVLSNSNLTVHTWPEHGALHFDLVTCSPIFDKSMIAETVSKLFSTDSVEVSFVE